MPIGVCVFSSTLLHGFAPLTLILVAVDALEAADAIGAILGPCSLELSPVEIGECTLAIFLSVLSFTPFAAG